MQYNNLLDEETAYTYRTFVYLAASASAEFFADIALSPLEAAKVGPLKSIFYYITKFSLKIIE